MDYLDFDGNRGSRFFIVAAGIGADAHLFYKLNPRVKGHLGMAAYYAMATRLWLTHPMENFAVEIESGRSQSSVSQLLAVRICNFGGVLRELAPGASLERDDLRLVLFRTRSRLAYLHYIVRGLVGAHWQVEESTGSRRKIVACRSKSESILAESTWKPTANCWARCRWRSASCPTP